MKTYPIVCPSCMGTGHISQNGGTFSASKKQCPACKGSGTVMVCETNNSMEKGDGYEPRPYKATLSDIRKETQ